MVSGDSRLVGHVVLGGHHVDGAEVSVAPSTGVVERPVLVHAARSTILDVVIASVALVEASVVPVVKPVVGAPEVV